MLFLGSCKSIKIQAFQDLEVKTIKNAEKVLFQVKNVSNQILQLDNIKNHYIQRREGENWVRVPYVPCPCGVPCRPEVAKELNPENSIDLTWNYLSRKCKGREATESTNADGEFRIRINYKVIDNELITRSDHIWVTF